MFDQWQSRLRSLKLDIHALWLAYRDPRVPWYAKALAACVLVYAMSPIDLIPDFIPVVGHLDDLVLIPAGLYLVFRLVPKQVLEECRQRARGVADQQHPIGWIGAGVVVSVWVALLLLLGWVFVLAIANPHMG